MVAVLGLGGCANDAREYQTPTQLVQAFIDAGGSCDDPAEVPEAMVGEGAHATGCFDDGVNMLIVFDAEEQQNRYIAEVASPDTALISGPRWVVVTEQADELADKMGGEVVRG